MKNVLYTIIFTLLIFSACTTASKDKSENTDSAISIDEEGSAYDRQFLVEVGDEAPDFTMEMPDGSTVKLSELRGKIVMLQFTASWCGVCRKEMPYIEEQIWQKHKDNPSFALFGIDREEPVEKIAVLREATGVTYPIGLDPDASIFGRFAENNAGITRNIIINKEGKIVMLTRLFEMEEFNEMVEMIDTLLES